MNSYQHLNLKTVKMKKYLLKEIEYHLRMLNNKTIDKDGFVQAIHEIYTHYLDDASPSSFRGME